MPSETFRARFPAQNNPDRLYDLVLSVSTNDQPSNNQSIVNWTLRVERVGLFQSWSFDQRPWSTTIDGFNTSGTWAYDFRNYSSLTLGTGSRTVGHNSDGSKTITVAASADGGNPLGSTSLSRSFALTTYPRAPSAPSFVNAQTPVLRSITVDWGPSSGGAGVSSYEVEQRESTNAGASFGGWSRVFATTAINNRVATFTSLNPQSTYQYRVRGIGPGGTSGYTNSGLQTIAPAATAPTVAVSRTIRTVEVQIGQSTPLDGSVVISGYTSQRRESTNGGVTWGPYGDTKQASTSERITFHSNLNPLSTYQFRARAETNLGPSPYTQSETVFVPGLPDPPSQLVLLRVGAGIQVSVGSPSGDGGAPVLSYLLQKRVSDGFTLEWSDWDQGIILPFNQPVYLYENLELQKTYQFRALATNSEGNSEQFTESLPFYLPVIVKIYDASQQAFRFPDNYKIYKEDLGWVGITRAQRYFNGEWFDLE